MITCFAVVTYDHGHCLKQSGFLNGVIFLFFQIFCINVFVYSHEIYDIIKLLIAAIATKNTQMLVKFWVAHILLNVYIVLSESTAH